MILIIILACIIIQRIAGVGGGINNEWVQIYLKKFQTVLSKFNSWVILFFTTVPFLVGLSLLHLLSLRHLYGLTHFLLMLIVLFFATDMRDLRDRLVGYFAALDKNKVESAANLARKVFAVPKTNNSHVLSRSVTTAIFTYSFEFVFAPLFWFIVLNIYGITFYYLITGIRKNALAVSANYEGLVRVATLAQNILNWLPMRILALSYALAGHFMISFTDFYQKIASRSFRLDDFVVKPGLLAIEADLVATSKSDANENHSALSLINRVLFIWVAALALFILGRWIT
jgi:membrane protein required for beta-lactamase induction